MENKYKKRAEEILIKFYTDYADSVEHGFGTPYGKEGFIKTMTTEINGRHIPIEAMCELAEEVKEYHRKFIEAHIFYPKNKPLYTKEHVEALLQKQRELSAENAKLTLFDYIKDSFKKIDLNKTHYSINDGNYLEIDKESILNAKLKID